MHYNLNIHDPLNQTDKSKRNESPYDMLNDDIAIFSRAQASCDGSPL